MWDLRSVLWREAGKHLRKLVLTYAQMENYQCREAENGEQALALCSGKRRPTSSFWM